MVNLLILLSLSTVLQLTELGAGAITRYGIDLKQLLILCSLWGFGGALMSLALSRWMAKLMMGVNLIPADSSASEADKWLRETTHRLARKAGLDRMPEVGIYESEEVNAFATGPSRNRALVAVSRGLLDRMNQDEIEGVIGHEIAHIANGDMITMTLVQGLINSFVMFFARIISFLVGQNFKEENRAVVSFFVTITCEVVLSFFAMFLVAWVSRTREFRADKGGSALAGREKMVAALRKLKACVELNRRSERQPALQTLKISGRGGILALLSTHPNLDLRIRRLQS